MNTTEKVRLLASTGNYETMEALRKDVGVTRERVRQIIRAENIPWQDYRVMLEWDCPGCGAAIRIGRGEFNNERKWNHMPAHCRECSKRDYAEFCKRGHLRAENTNKRGACAPCLRAYNRCVTEVRTCIDCGKPLNISRGVLRQIKMGYAHGESHIECYYQREKR